MTSKQSEQLKNYLLTASKEELEENLKFFTPKIRDGVAENFAFCAIKVIIELRFDQSHVRKIDL